MRMKGSLDPINFQQGKSVSSIPFWDPNFAARSATPRPELCSQCDVIETELCLHNFNTALFSSLPLYTNPYTQSCPAIACLVNLTVMFSRCQQESFSFTICVHQLSLTGCLSSVLMKIALTFSCDISIDRECPWIGKNAPGGAWKFIRVVSQFSSIPVLSTCSHLVM